MALDYPLLLWAIKAFVLLDLLLLALLFLGKLYYRRRYRKKVMLSAFVHTHMLSGEEVPAAKKILWKNPGLFLRVIKELGDTVHLPGEVENRWFDLLRKGAYVKKMCRRLDSPLSLRRIEAATGLGIIGGDYIDGRLLERLRKERRWYIRLIIIHILTRHRYAEALPEILGVLKDAPWWVRQKSFAVLPGYGEVLEEELAKMVEDPGKRDLELLFELGEQYSCDALNEFLVSSLRSSHATLARRAAIALEQSNPAELQADEFVSHPDESIRSAAVRSLKRIPDSDTLTRLLVILGDESRRVRRAAVLSLQEVVFSRPKFLEAVVEAFEKTENTVMRRNLARVLESRIEYFLYRVNTDKYRTVRALIKELAKMKRLSVVFGFLERNRTAQIEEAVLEILASIAADSPEVEELCSLYLSPRLLEKIHLDKKTIESTKESVPLKKTDKRLLIAALAAVVLSGPLVYAVCVATGLGGVFAAPELAVSAGGYAAYLAGYSGFYNFVFAFYSIAVNSIYLFLLVCAFLHLIRQHRHWSISSFDLLFAKDLLPSISILAPAYNEELNIVDNVKSLVNLHYPDVEVIVINDGSKDGTLEQLIENFRLERVDREGKTAIETEPVRGIYISSQFPNLTVIDKVNGGKADSLNAGINLASRDFICTIDSDSLLEHDALLKAAFLTVLSDREPVALGGNIIPANGCTVRNGKAVKIALGRDHLSRFQTIEYMRAFLAGRLGWSFINSMVIISGAFGLFIRKRVVEIGGYLTPKSRHRASTVGEDMELVVRLHKHMREKKLPYKVYDAFNANCWTEVPDSFKILHRQRDRWHRGLMETLLHHKRLAFNPRYGPVGAVAFPYFIIFELIGPFLELFGYINLILSLVFGLITGPVALLLFISVILYGILLSLGSLLISENEVLYFSTPETFKIIFYAFVENFGFRQVMSAIRVTAYVSFLFKEKSWGEMKRKGFTGGGK
ncbi:MAG: glycosyltransferase [Spirochaetia bacterium]